VIDPWSVQDAAVIDDLPVPCVAYDAAGRIIAVNRRAEDLFQQSRASLAGRRLEDLVGAAPGGCPPESVFEKLSNGTAEINARFLRDDQGRRTVLASCTAAVLRDGALRGAIATFRDVTESSALDQALRAREAHLSVVLEHIPAVIWTVNAQLQFTSSSGAGLKALGVRGNELLGMSLEEYFHSTDPEYAPLKAHRAALRGQSVTYTTEWQGLHYEGHVEPLRGPDGQIEGVVGIAHDVTEHTLAVRELEQAQSLYRLITENANDIIAIIEAGGHVDYISPAVRRVLGHTPESMQSTSLFDWIHADDEAELRAAIAAAPVQRTVMLTFRVRSAAGGWRWLDTQLDAVPGNTRLLAIGRDVTERRSLEEQLLHSQKLESVGRLAGGVAHDFNNLLTVILGQADLLYLQMGADERVREAIEQVRQAGDRAAQLTAQLLAFGRRQMIAPKVVDLNALLDNLEKLLRRLISERIRLSVVAMATHAVRVDPGQLENVIVNLVVNAQDAMPSGGALTIETADVDIVAGTVPGVPAGTYVVLSVADTGIGMDADVLEHIFEPFFTTKAPGKGSGLGLAMCYGAVQQAGGHLRADSLVGRGTTFRIYLPASSGVREQTQHKKTRTLPPGGDETILLAEDDPLLARLIERVLGDRGYRILSARNGRDAISAAEQFEGRIDLLITDVVLPEINGPEVARTLVARCPELRVLYVSGYAPEGTFPADAGENVAFLPKPFAPSELVTRVRELLQGSS
jgi:PAS domain S-box-containing protein